MARHEVLRTTFAVVEGEPVQRIQAVEQARFRAEGSRICGERARERSEELARRIERGSRACLRSGERATDSRAVAAGGRRRARAG